MNATTTKPETNGGQLTAVRSPISISLNFATLPEIREFCGILSKTTMVPKGYIGKPDDILVAVMHGVELGLPPLQALQSIAVINGIPSIYGDAALALVRRSGLLEEFDEWIEIDGVRVDGPVDIVHEADQLKKKVVGFCKTKRVGMKERLTWFSVDQAKRAHLWLKKGHEGKETPWCTYPDRMLMWRPRGFNLRDNFGDVLKGLILAEEAMDIDMERGPGGDYRMAAMVEDTPKTAPVDQTPSSTPNGLSIPTDGKAVSGQTNGDRLLKKMPLNTATAPASVESAKTAPAETASTTSAPVDSPEKEAAYKVLKTEADRLVAKFTQTGKGAALLKGAQKDLKLGQAEAVPTDPKLLGMFVQALQAVEGKL